MRGVYRTTKKRFKEVGTELLTLIFEVLVKVIRYYLLGVWVAGQVSNFLALPSKSYILLYFKVKSNFVNKNINMIINS